MNIVIGIPARMGASRFPGKPLCKILGVPMVEHVYRRCLLGDEKRSVFVATCDDVIKETVERMGGTAIMTDPNIERPALRVAEACKTLALKDDDIVVVVQGDEPLVNPKMLDMGIEVLRSNPDILCSNLCADVTLEELKDPNEVKVVMDLEGNALYMSRAAIPHNLRTEGGPVKRQLGIFFFYKKVLLDFQALSPTPLERVESIEMLRAIEHRKKVRMVYSPFKSKGVDTEEDRKEAERLMEADPIWAQYSKETRPPRTH